MRPFAIALLLVFILLGRCDAFVKPAFGRWVNRSKTMLFGLRCGHQNDLACNEEGATEAPLIEEQDGEEKEDQEIIKRDFLRLQYRRVRHAVAKILVFSKDDSLLRDGTGSGVLWDDDGHVVTCYHNIQNATRISLRLGGMLTSVDVKILGAEPERDIAVLKITSDEELPEPILKTTAMDLYPGEPVLAAGNPPQSDFTMTSGIVSALWCDALISGQTYPGCVLTDATTGIGFSGGPLVNEWGELVGIIIGGPKDMGHAFAIPSETVNRIVRQIIVNGTSTRPAIGGYVFSHNVERNFEATVGDMVGVLILRLVPNSPLADAGLIPVNGDCDSPTEGTHHFIAKVDGMRVHKVGQLRTIIDAKEPGDVLELEAVRIDGEGELVTETLLVNVTSAESLDIDKETNWINGENASMFKVARTNNSGGITVDKNGDVHFDDNVHEEDVTAEDYDLLI